MLGKIRKYIGELRAFNRERRQVMQAVATKKEILKAGIVRLVHAVEKGLSIESPRAGFGYEKIITMYGWIREYLDLDGIDKTCVYMAADALSAYLGYHEAIGFGSDKIDEIKLIASELKKIKENDKVEGVFGGVLTLEKASMEFDASEVERLFKTRHSIRQFNKEPVPNECIEKAIELAQTAPSACNRQAVRSYALDVQKFIDLYPSDLQGVGGFLEGCDKVIMITGKLSSYEEAEYKQFIVSAGIFVGYLTLALHALGLGSCVVQRQLRPNKAWEVFCQKNDIPADEQLVCLVTVGQMKEKTVVPRSKRFDTEKIFRWL